MEANIEPTRCINCQYVLPAHGPNCTVGLPVRNHFCDVATVKDAHGRSYLLRKLHLRSKALSNHPRPIGPH